MIALPGTRLEHETPACLVLQIEACDAIGAAALAERQMKVRISLLMDPPQEIKTLGDSTRSEMLQNPAIRLQLETTGAKDDGQSASFIKALLSTPGYMTPVAFSGSGTLEPGGPSEESSIPSGKKSFISISLFKEKTRNRKITKMPAASPQMIRALRLLVSKGFIKAVHRHQTSAHRSSSMYICSAYIIIPSL